MVKVLRYILFPFALVYGGIVFLRNKLFDFNILKSSRFDVKTILVGNLSAGGTGKTPHIEYLVKILNRNKKLATLSRGYGRKTHGFILANENSTAKDIGDEPLQFFNKFSQVKVAVSAKRVDGVIELMSLSDSPEVILLDDAFQHRQLKAGLSILLMDFNAPFYRDFMLPTGNLREFSFGKKRADIIIVTKCPADLSGEEQELVRSKISACSIPVFFSNIVYGKPELLFGSATVEFDKAKRIVLVTGIANSNPLLDYITTFRKEITHLNYPDHHSFSKKEVDRMKHECLKQPDSVILTTEKDAMRLREFDSLEELPLFYLPIEVKLLDNENKFLQLIYNYVKND